LKDELMRTDTFDSRVVGAIGEREIDEAIRRARHMQAEEFHRQVSRLTGAVASLVATLRRRHELSVAYQTLMEMDARGLADIGLSRGQIAQAVYGPEAGRGWLRRLAEATSKRIADWRHRNATRAELLRLDNRSLEDIGLNRGDLQLALRGILPPGRSTANENSPRDAA
jgi:uncharacterized protein YjiS (DUF1127 family)